MKLGWLFFLLFPINSAWPQQDQANFAYDSIGIDLAAEPKFDHTKNTGTVHGKIERDLATGLNSPFSIILHESTLYLTEFGKGFGALDGKICKIDLGSSKEHRIIDLVTGLDSPYAIALKGNSLYFAEIGVGGPTGKISKIDLTSSRPSKTLLLDGLKGPTGLLCNGNDLYFAELEGGKISKMDITTLNPRPLTLATGLHDPYDLALKGNDLYFSERGMANKISKIDLTSALPAKPMEVIGGLNWPSGIFIKDDYLYVAEFLGGRISKIDLRADKPERLEVILGLQTPSDIVLRGDNLFICESDGGAIINTAIKP